jgi:hypothetical protein
MKLSKLLCCEIFHRLKDLKTSQLGFFDAMFAWIKLRWRQAFPARDVKRIGIYELRRPDSFERLASPWYWGSPEKLTKRNSLAFSVYFLRGLALGKLEELELGNQARLPNHNVAMHFCFASIPLRVTLNSTPSRRLKKT